ncbi:MAG: hypothetical protein FD180_3975 [Planctomycetota bacterium]|nr:MAG: hypothetical protein FD180_3975 [Planctomycetota bacterium]
MRPFITLLLLAIAASSSRAQTWDPKVQFKSKRLAAEKRIAETHMSLGRFADGERLFAAARHQYLRAAELDPGSEDAQKALGRTLVDGKWVQDARWPVYVVNDRPAIEMGAALAKFRSKNRIAAKASASEYEDLADFAANAELALEARAMWEAMARYEPSNPRAQTKLGWRKLSGEMLSASEADAREAMAKRILEAPGGKPQDATSDVEEKTGQNFTKRRSEHFYFESMYTDGELRALVRAAETTRALFIETFQVPPESEPAFLKGVFVRFQGDHRLFLEKCTDAGALERKTAEEMSTWEEFDPHRFEVWLGERPFEALRDEAVHATVRYAFHDLTRMPETPGWLSEGVCAWFGDRVLGRAEACFAREDARGKPRTKSTLRWRQMVREWAWEGTAPPIREVTKAAPGELTFEMTVKAWSMVDWLMTAKRDRLYDFLARCRAGSSGKALRRALGAKDYDELEMMWQEWVNHGQ